MTAAYPHRIDVHQHVLPPGYLDALGDIGTRDSGGRAFPSWTPQQAIEFMDRFGIDVGLLSVSAPGVWLGEASASADLARRVNDHGAELVKDRPDRFGHLASLPLPDVDTSCVEARRAHDDLGADGFILLANNDGVYLGDPVHDPVFEVLDAWSAVVLVHPTSLPGATPVDGIPPFAVDFLLDTTRAAVNLVLHDVPTRFPHVRFVLSHAGGFLPYASHRIAALTAAHGFQTALGTPAHDVGTLLASMRGFWFDTALSSSGAALPSLLEFARPDRVVFGSDHPYAPDDAVEHFTAEYEGYDGLDDEARRLVDRGNAEQLFPRLTAAPPHPRTEEIPGA